MNTPIAFRVLSLAVLLGLFSYIMVSPSLELKKGPEEQLRLYVDNLEKLDSKEKKRVQELAQFDLEHKVYPEIQDRMTKVNDWLITKITFAGALLGAFLFQLWWPFWSKNRDPNPGRDGGAGTAAQEERENQVAAIFNNLLRARQISGVLGIACIVTLFMDLHIRRSSLVILQLGAWAEYADKTLNGKIVNFSMWEQFIRMPPDTPGMHQSIIEAIQSGNQHVMTLVLFAFYHWSFQAACRQKLDELNRLIYVLFICVLFIFLIGAHRTAGNFKFTDYGHGDLFSNFSYYFIAWFVFAMILVLWDVFGSKNTKADKSQQRPAA